MRSFIRPNRRQQLLMTQVNLDSVAPKESAVWRIDQLVDMLDTTEIERQYDLGSSQGRNPIHPKTIIKVALFALHNCRFSLRKMQADIENHLAYKWLTGDRPIDHSTIGYFLSRFREEIVDLFAQVVMICRQQELLEFEILAVDSVKLRANASYKQNRTMSGIEKEEEKIKERLREILKGMTEGKGVEEEEAQVLAMRMEGLEEAKAILAERIKQKSEGKSEKESAAIEDKEKVNLTDVDAHIMEQANGEKNPAYSVTTTIDTANDIVTHFQVNPEDNDSDVLLGAIDGSRETTGERHEVVDADSGFASKENYEELEEDGQAALIPDRRMGVEERGETSKGDYDRSQFRYDASSDSYECPAGKLLEKQGELDINGRLHNRYGNAQACRECSFRANCTKSDHRTIFRDQKEEYQERMRDRLRMEENRKTYNRRAHAGESPYGHIKRNLKFTYVMRRGIEKVCMETSLLCMLHNILKVGALVA